MIKFDRSDNKVAVTISPYIDSQAMVLYFDANDEWYASLLAKHLQEVLWGKLRAIREEAYTKGWGG